MSALKTFQERFGAVEIAVTAYENALGEWAKDETEVTRVRIRYVDHVTIFLTPEEVRSLPKDQKDAINHAPSSPLQEDV